MATKNKKGSALRGWSIAFGVILLIVGILSVYYGVNNYTPAEGYYGNGKEWKSTDRFYPYYADMPTLTLKEGQTKLKIMQITDAQLKFGTFTQDTQTMDLLDKALKVVKPDVCVVTGDLTLSLFASGTVDYFCKFLESRKVYWCFTYGNHDSEFSLSKYRHSQIFSKYKYCLFDGGPSNIKGESNYFVKVNNFEGQLLYALCMVDSNMYPDSRTGITEMVYDEVSAEQADWYEWNINGLRGYKSDLQTMAFLHIPFRSYVDMYYDIQNGVVTKYNGFVAEEGWTFNNPYSGTKIEMPGIFCQGGNLTADYNGGGYTLYDKIVALGSTKTVMCGHDHLNNLRGVDKNGVLLAYGRCCGYHTYPFFKNKDDMPIFHGIMRDVLGYKENQLFFDLWVDPDTGKQMEKGVTVAEVDLSDDNYGATEIYDLSHGTLSEGKIVKEYQLGIN